MNISKNKIKNSVNRDQELDDLLFPLQNLDPSLVQMQTWSMAVDKIEPPSRFRFFHSLKVYQVATAFSVGIVIGAISFHSPQNKEKNEASATIEEVFTKSE